MQPVAGKNVSVGSRAYQNLSRELAGAPWIAGNEVTTYVNGDEFFPAMIAAMGKARKSITLETFAFVDSGVTREISALLAKKAQEGVAVHLILDSVGSRNMGEGNFTLMKNAGVQIELFRPFNYFIILHSNCRTHRKILITDGKTAFTGGSGFAHAWMGNAKSPEHWRDTHFGLTGPAVATMQRTFTLNWWELTGKMLSGPDYFPPLKKTGTHLAQLPAAGFDSHDHNLANSYLAAINAAQESLFLQQAYFIPNRQIRTALAKAKRRGVEVTIMVPGPLIDSKLSLYASQNYWRELLHAGARLFQYEPTMMHAKVLVADRKLSLVGSANIDPRSFNINDENNLHVISESFANEQIKIIENNLHVCQEITLENLNTHLAPLPFRWAGKIIEGQL